MKNKYIILLSVFAFFVSSCGKFLDEMPDNRTELDSEEKMLKLLTSAYADKTYAFFTELMSDNFDDWGSGYGATYTRFMEQAWGWQPITEEGNDSSKDTWAAFYLAIAHANQVLQAIDELGNPVHLDAYRGEALMSRAFHHFKLVNVFCQHYTEEFSGTDLGIPYMEAPETQVDPKYTRGTVKEVYEKIDRDIQEALPLIDDNIYTVPKYHFNRLAAYGFAAYFYLLYKDYDKVIEYATEVLGDNPTSMLRDVSTFSSLPTGEPQFRAYIASDVKANLLLITNVSSIGTWIGPWTVGKRFMHSQYTASTEGLYANSVLWSSSGTATTTFQLRPLGYYSAGAGTPIFYTRCTVPYIFEYTDPVAGIGYAHSIMVAVSADNALLCRAEAYVHKENYTAATNDINMWVQKRIVAADAGPKTEDQISNYYEGLDYSTPTAPTVKKKLRPEDAFVSDKQEAFIHAILQLRRIEFFGEGTRWFDIKRYNIEVSRRELRTATSGSVPDINVLTTLGVRDYRMPVQLPTGVISAGMTPNPRED